MSYRPTPLSVPVSKRARPLLGTLVRVEVDGVKEKSVNEAFVACEDLQSVFSKFDPQSALNRFRQSPRRGDWPFALTSALKWARDFARESEGAFQLNEDSLDLTGLAKGWIADHMAAMLERQGGRGVVNAGGDLRFFGSAPPFRAHVRLAGGVRLLESLLPAVATSSLQEALDNPESSTVYPLPLRAGLNRGHSVTVLAPLAVVADAMTKVALFGMPERIAHCAQIFGAHVLVLDEDGELRETYGAR